MTVSFLAGDNQTRSAAPGSRYIYSPRSAADIETGRVARAEPFPPPLTASDIARMHSEEVGSGRGRVATVTDAEYPGPAPFPHPPTLADIYRMEPDLSPLSMRRRASDCGYDDPALRSFACSGYPRGAFDEVIEEASPLLFSCCEEAELADYEQFAAPHIDDVDPKEEQRLVLTAVAEWISDYMYEMACSGRIPNPFSMPIAVLPFTRSLNIQRITNILLSTLMPTSAPFLALVYVNRLVDKIARRLVRGSHDGGVKAFIAALTTGGPLTVDTLITRYLMVGLMLADKWLDDHSFAVRTWRDVSYIPARVLHSMEMAALRIFDYHLMIPQAKWVDYLERLCAANDIMLGPQMASLALPPTAIVHLVLRDLIDASHAARAEIEPQFLEHTRLSPPPPPPRPLPKMSALQDSWAAMHVQRYPAERPLKALAPPRAPSASKRKLSPSEWSPQADPIVSKARRTSSSAVGAERFGLPARREPHWVNVTHVTEKILGSGAHARAVSVGNARASYADFGGYLNRPLSLIEPIEPLRVINV